MPAKPTSGANLVRVASNVDLDAIRERIRASFDDPNEVVADVWIELGRDATAEQIAERAKVTIDRVQVLMRDLDWLDSVVCRKLDAKAFTPVRMREFFSGSLRNLSTEHAAQMNVMAIQGAKPKDLETRMLAILKIMEKAEKLESMRQARAEHKVPLDKIPRNPEEALAEMLANPIARFFYEKWQEERGDTIKDVTPQQLVALPSGDDASVANT